MIVVSGGQTGADQAGIRAALKHGITVEGWAPRHWKTEDGPDPRLEEWGLKEHAGGYKARTVSNVAVADAVLIFGRESTGSVLTKRLARQHAIPWAWCWWTPFYGWEPRTSGQIVCLLDSNPERLMIAGNRESKNPGIGSAVFDLMDQVFEELA